MHYLNHYATFENTAQLNRATYLHIRNNTHLLNETDRSTLKILARYAVKYAGAAHLKADTLAQLIGKSTKTARRVVAKLERLNIVKKYGTIRKVNGGKGANIIVIQPAEEVISKINVQSTLSSRAVGAEPTESKANERKSASEPSNSIKLLKRTLTDTPSSPVSALRSALPPAIYNVMSPFFNAEDLYRNYGLLLKAKRKIAPDTLIENDADPYIDAFNAVMFKAKRGLIRNLERYLYVAFEKAAAEVTRRASRTDNDEKALIHYDWLGA